MPVPGHPQGVPLRIDANGDLVVATEGGEVIFHKPVVYQPGLSSVAGSSLVTRHSSLVQGGYRLEGNNHIRFEVGPYNHSKPLVIDPVLAYSTYLGGSGRDDGYGIAVDASGNAYVIGSTRSSNFPTTSGAFQTTCGGQCEFDEADAFASKLNAVGSALMYSTYLGGSGADSGRSIAVDASGNAYVTGITHSSDFPTTPGAFQTASAGNGDTFVSKLNAAGSALMYSTYLGEEVGGNPDDSGEGDGIAVDASGNAYVTGMTSFSDFPTTPGAFQTISPPYGGAFAFVSKLNAAGSALVYSTYLGEGIGSGIAADASGNAYVTGSTGSDFPTTSAPSRLLAPGATRTSATQCLSPS